MINSNGIIKQRLHDTINPINKILEKTTEKYQKNKERNLPIF
jgi:hypothetical protein